jgi:hypothetical protein
MLTYWKLASFTITTEDILYASFAWEHHGSSGLGGTKVVSRLHITSCHRSKVNEAVMKKRIKIIIGSAKCKAV